MASVARMVSRKRKLTPGGAAREGWMGGNSFVHTVYREGERGLCNCREGVLCWVDWRVERLKKKGTVGKIVNYELG